MMNQAVLFTKPVHHLGLDLSADQLDQEVRDFFGTRGFPIVLSRRVTGPELAIREIIRQHYLIYSKASYGDLAITDEGRDRFRELYGRHWDDEVGAGRIMGNPKLLESRGLDAHALFDLWNVAEVKKVQTGLLMAWLDPLDCFCINAFYPAMEANFYDPLTVMDYYVVEFDSAENPWIRFRKEVLGATNAAKAAPGSFRGRLYARYPVDFPGRDNFIHGSAGPFEGMVERAIHEEDFRLAENPIGRYLEPLGVTLDRFRTWKARLSNSALAELFDTTEEKNTDDIIPTLDMIAGQFS